jgi:hypothetical protein
MPTLGRAYADERFAAAGHKHGFTSAVHPVENAQALGLEFRHKPCGHGMIAFCSHQYVMTLLTGQYGLVSESIDWVRLKLLHSPRLQTTWAVTRDAEISNK